jgi:probable HAF family extracellular repeat protein
MVRFGKHFLACGLICLSLTAHAAVSYSIIDLGTFRGGDSVQADAINDSGVVVGADGNAGIGFYWNASLHSLPPLSADNNSAAGAINSLGWIVGQSFNIGGGGQQGTLWVNGVPSLLPVPGMYVDPLGINTAGSVVGSTGSAVNMQAFLLPAGASSSINLGTLGGATASASAINDAGVVVGSAASANGNTRAFVWQSGHMTQLSDLGLSSGAFCINQQGVAGGFVLRPNFTAQPALWAANGTRTDLPALPGFADAEVYGVNQSLQAVGDADANAVLWSGGNVQSLLSLIPSNSGWSSLNYAYGINDAGDIVGWGKLDSNNTTDQAFLLVPVPEPSGLLPFGGLLILVLHRSMSRIRKRSRAKPSR